MDRLSDVEAALKSAGLGDDCVVVRLRGGSSANKPSDVSPFLGRRLSSPALIDAVFETALSAADVPFLTDYRCCGVPAVPASCHLTLAIHAAQSALSLKRCAVDDAGFLKGLAVPEGDARKLQLILSIGDGLGEYFKVVSPDGASWTTHAAGSIVRLAEESGPALSETALSLREQMPQLAGDAIYEAIRQHDLQLGPAVRGIEAAWRNDNTALAKLRLPVGIADDKSLPIHPLLLDVCFQLPQFLTPGRPGHCLVPTSLERLAFFGAPASSELWCHAKQRASDEGDLVFDVGLFETSGRRVVSLRGVSFDFLPSEVLQSVLRSSLGAGDQSPNAAQDHPARTEFIQRLKELTPAKWPNAVQDLIRGTAGELLSLLPDRPFPADQGFFDAGMNSVKVTQLSARLEAVFGCRLPATLAFKYSTPAALAKFLCQEMVDLRAMVDDSAKPASVVAARSDTTTPVACDAQTITREPIAIIGAACRFPGGANSLDDFWRLLHNGVDAVTEIPKSRWDLDEFARTSGLPPGTIYAKHAGLLDQTEIEAFDPQFFGIAPREADAIDPQQRKLMEVSWEAMEHAGVPVKELKGSRTGVFFGSSTDDYLQMFNNLAAPAGIDTKTSLGTSRAIAAGRVAYALGLQGPAVQLDTACSSSLSAVHLACQSLLLGDCDVALAGAVNLLLSPVWMSSLCELKALSPDGRCHTFDAKANGFVRGEGCAVVVLKRLSDAQRDGDRILAQIVGSAVNHDGRSSGMTVPNEQAQEALHRQALRSAGLEPGDVSYIEAHGTGTSLGDPIEMGALKSVYAPGRAADKPLLIGSVKTNIGHLEAAAGMAGLLKVVVSLQHGEIPASLHFHEPNPLIPWDGFPVRVASERTAWNGPRRIAGISSFGFSGTNAHLLVEAPPAAVPLPTVAPERPLHILPISADNERTLHELRLQYAEFLTNTNVPFADIAHTAAAGRSHFSERLVVIAANCHDAAEQLQSSGILKSDPDVAAGDVAFLFPLATPEFLAASLDLIGTLPSLRRALEEINPHFEAATGQSLFSVLDQNDIAFLEPAVLCLQFALAEVWREWGLKPTSVTGWGVGEIAAACQAGVISLADAIRLATSPESLTNFTFQPPQIDVFSAATGENVSTLISQSEFWHNRLLAAQLSETAIAALEGNGCGTFVELGPRTDAEHSKRLYSFDTAGNSWAVLLRSLGELYIRGVDIDWKAFDRDHLRRKCALPRYPFQRRRHWIDRVETSRVALFAGPSAKPSDQANHPLLGIRQETSGAEIAFLSPMDLKRFPMLADHRVLDGQAVLPATAYLEMALAAGRHVHPDANAAVDSLAIAQAMILTESATVEVRTTLTRHDDAWSCSFESRPLSDASQKRSPAEWTRHATARITISSSTPNPVSLSDLKSRCTQPIDVEQHYQSIRSQGLEYGPLFRSIRQLSLGKHEALARVELAPEIAASVEFLVHPVLLDASLQPITALLPATVSYLPVGIGRLERFDTPGSQVWSHVRLHDGAEPGARSLTADVTLLNDRGEIVAAVANLKLLRVERGQRAARQIADWLHRVDWTAKPLEILPPARPTGTWLILSDNDTLSRDVNTRLQSSGRCLTVSSERITDIDRLLSENRDIKGIVHLGSLSLHAADDQRSNCESVLKLVQGLAKQSKPVPLRLVTRGVQSLDEKSSIDVSQSPLWGLGRVIALEHPELKCVRVDLDSDPHADNAAALLQELVAADGENEIAYRGGVRHVARLVKHRPETKAKLAVPPTPFRLQLSEFGVFETFRAASIDRRAPAAGEVEVEVAAVGLNFRDVLRALGLLRNYEQITSATSAPFGFECAGTVLSVGAGVSDLQTGDRVVVVSTGCLASHLTVQRNEVAKIPSDAGFIAAAAAPVAYMTAQHALVRLAKLKPGQRVLIHAAAGGVGQAAVRIAQQLGAEIFATASPGKHDLLKSQGIAHVFNSRSTEFAEEIHKLTNGRGIDVILNSLNGEFIPAGLKCLSSGGTFIEIGKIDTWTPEQVTAARPDVHYFKFDLGEEDRREPGFMGRLLAEVAERYLGDASAALPVRVFPLEDVTNGFRYMARAQHVGKIVFDLHPRIAATRTPNTCLITGGLGALGRLVAKWAVQRGATHLALLSRSADEARHQDFLQELEQDGALLRLFAVDVSRRDDLQAVLTEIAETMPPLKGVVHAAAVLDDGMLDRQDWTRFEKVLAPKAYGAWHLHELTQQQSLDYFVCFSSTSSLTGWAGQGNYAAANALLDALAHHRRALGLPGLSVNWGPWGGSGMASSLSARDQARLADAGLQTIDPALGLEALSLLLAGDAAQVAVLPVDWEKFGKFLGRMPLWSGLMRSSAEPAAPQSAVLDSLRNAPPAERPKLLRTHLRGEVITVLGLDAARAVPTNVGFTDLGMDSLTSAEFRTRLQSSLGCALPTTLTFDHPTLDALTTYLLKEKIVSEPIAAPGSQSPRPRLGGEGQGEGASASSRSQTISSNAGSVANDAIAVIGMSCRMPGGDTPEAYWDLLVRGEEAIREVPADRWDINAYYDADPDAPGKMWTRHGGFCSSVTDFDAAFFGIMPREAHALDPQQRLLLELSHEALEDAGVAADKIAGSEFGVFVGICGSDYLVLSMRDANQIDAYLGTGTTHSPAAGRISYTFGLRGPAVAVDTACSSALVALHFACQSLRSGECNLAFAGGVNLILAPEMSINFTKARMLSREGRCKTFDAAADGYVRGEGGGMVLLKRLADAQADGDRILAVIRGTAVNQDGRSSGLTAPNGPAQADVIRRAISQAGLQPNDISYLEAHGTGTSLGDPIELGAVADVFGPKRETPLVVGSVKTNIGHLETASGMAGLIKVILALRNEMIPKHLHFQTPNPKVAWDGLPVEIPVAARPWPKTATPRRAGVSSFGFSGTNAHIIVEEAPAPRVIVESEPPVERPLHILPLSAKSDASLAGLADAYISYLNQSNANVADIVHAAGAGRSHWPRRLAVIGATRDDLRTQLENFRAGKPGVATGQADDPPEVAMLFTGQGSQFAGMGRLLYDTQPTFRKALERCDEILYSIRRKSLLSVIYPETNNGLIDQTEWTQPALFSLEYALFELWKSWGIEPAAVMGHSVGEYVAAVAAGVFSLEDGLKLIAARGRLIQSLPAGGGMCVVMADEDTVRSALAGRTDVAVAAINGPRQIVISGSDAALAPVIAEFAARQIATTKLTVSHAFHSHLMEPSLGEFHRIASEVRYSPPQIPLISNVTGTKAGREIATSDYWRDHIRNPVQFTRGVAALAEQSRVFLEIGPQPILTGLGKRCVEDPNCVWLPSLQKNTSDWQALLTSLSQLYVHGANVDWGGFDREYRRRNVSVPKYPFQRKTYWLKRTPVAAAQPRAAMTGGDVLHPLLGQRVSLAAGDVVFTAVLGSNAPAYLADHTVLGRPLFPATGYLETALAAGQVLASGQTVVVEDLSLLQPLALPAGASRTVQLVLDDQHNFRYFSQDEASASWVQHASGRIAFTAAPAQRKLDVAAIRARCAEAVPRDELYANFSAMGLDYGPTFQGVAQVWRGHGEAIGEVRTPAALASQAGQYHLHPALLDAALHVLAVAMPSSNDTYLPVGIERLVPLRPLPEKFFSHVRLRDPDDADAEFILADLKLIDGQNQTLAVLEGLRLKRVPKQSASPALASSPADDWLYHVAWRNRPVGEATFDGQGTWLIVSTGGETASAVANGLQRAGQRARITAATDVARQVNPLEPLAGVIHIAEPTHTEITDPLNGSLGDCESALHLVQALQKAGVKTRLWLVTQGAQAVAEGDPVDPFQTALWGLGRVINIEHPDLKCVRVDLDPQEDAESAAASLLAELAGDTSEEREIAYRQGERFVARLVKSSGPSSGSLQAPATPYRLQLPTYGSFDDFRFAEIDRTPPDAGQVEIEVHSAGLNFRDVLRALGMLQEYERPLGITSADLAPFGFECAGVVTAVGPGVAHLAAGDEVLAIGPGAIRSHIVLEAGHVAVKPENLNMTEAASVPLAFLTALYGLENLAHLQPGERVLIHAAAGGVGQAAVQIAQRLGAEIFATASPKKHDFLRQQGIEHVFNSRSTDFAEEILAATNGEGVDVVLNSLNGEFINASVKVLRNGCRFIEIGKIDIWTPEQMAAARPDVQYAAFDLGEEESADPGLIQSLLATLTERFAGEELFALPLKEYAIGDAVAAFREMAQGKHRGKLVLNLAHSAKPLVRDDGSYIVTGGLGGLGMEVARWIVSQGGSNLVLTGRRGADTADKQAAVRELEQAGATVQVVNGDVGDAQDAERIVASATQMAPLRGIIHAAGVLDDGMLAQQTWPRFQKVMQPKVGGAWQLDRLTADADLDFFVNFSSVASLLGSPGQGNYAAANSYLDGLAAQRLASGRPGVSIHWGPWDGAGMAARLEERDRVRMKKGGWSMLSINDGLAALERILKSPGPAQVGVLPLDWPTFIASGTDLPLFEELTAPGDSSNAATGGVLDELLAVSGDDRRERLTAFVRQEIAAVLACDAADIEPRDRLQNLGLDSLTSVELQNRLQRPLGLQLPTTFAFDYPTLEAMTEYLIGQLPTGPSAKPPQKTAPVQRPAPAPQPVPAAKRKPVVPIAQTAETPRAGGVSPLVAAETSQNVPSVNRVQPEGLRPPLGKIEAPRAESNGQAKEIALNGQHTKDELRADSIAIIGLACRVPGGGETPDAFWKMLQDGVSAVSDIPADRWDVEQFYDANRDAPGNKIYSRRGNFLPDVQGFDADFFGIAPREAACMDPQQRLLLETTWEALENAGCAPDGLYKSRTGVFVGISNLDYARQITLSGIEIEAHMGTGNSPSAAAGRLSYTLGFQGPSLAVDTACSSSLVAVHLACQALREQECDLAVAGGVNLMLCPITSVIFAKSRMLSADGQCKTFDAAADGYGRGEGSGILVLKRLSAAVADGDRIVAVIRGSAINQDGPSGGLTVPNGPSQQQVIQDALADADLPPADVTYIEAHGTGTNLGDPIEVGALGAVFGKVRSATDPLLVGTVKSNVGHLESAAGVTGLIKAALMLDHSEFVPNLHFETPNPHIPWSQLPVEVVTARQPWPANRPKVIGISSFGFTGTNAHIVMSAAPDIAKPVKTASRPELLILSARTAAALDELAARHAAFLEQHPSTALADVAYSLAVGRSHFEYRLAVVADSAEDAARQLRSGAEVDRGRVKKSAGKANVNVSTKDRAATLLEIGKQFTQGFDIRWKDVFAGEPRRKLALPTYAFQRQRYGIDLLKSDDPSSESGDHPLLGARLASASRDVQFQSALNTDRISMLADHRVGDAAVLPASAYLEIALAAAREVLPDDFAGIRLRDVALQQMLRLPAARSQTVQTIVTEQEAGFRLEFYSQGDDGATDWRLHATAQFEAIHAAEPVAGDLAALRRKLTKPRDLDEIYGKFQRFGLNYGPQFRSLRQLFRIEGEALAESEVAAESFDYLAHPVHVDACFQALAGALEGVHEATYLPIGLDRMSVFARFPERVWSHVVVKESRADVVVADATVFDADGTVLATIIGLRLQRVSRDVKPSTRSASSLSKASAKGDRAKSLAPSAAAEALAAKIKAGSDPDRKPLMVEYLQEELATVLRRTNRPDAEKSFSEMGMDSLMGVDFLYRIRQGLGLELPAEALMLHPTIVTLSGELLKQLDRSQHAANGASHAGSGFSALIADPFESAASPWFQFPKPSPSARVRLFCFPPIAGGASMYATLAEQLPPEIELCAVQLPGREDRAADDVLTDFPELLETLAGEFLDLLDRPFAFFGHSGGNLISYELAHLVQQRYNLRPKKLFVGAFWSPERAVDITSDPGVLIDKLKQPETLLVPRSNTAAGLAVVTADVDLFATYRYRERPPLKCPIIAFGGEEDGIISQDDLNDWCRFTQGGFQLELLPGTHSSYLSDPRVVELVIQELVQSA